MATREEALARTPRRPSWLLVALVIETVVVVPTALWNAWDWRREIVTWLKS